MGTGTVSLQSCSCNSPIIMIPYSTAIGYVGITYHLTVAWHAESRFLLQLCFLKSTILKAYILNDYKVTIGKG